MALTEAQQAIKAQTKIEKLALDEKLSNLKAKIDALFKDAPVAVAETTSKKEFEELIREVRSGKATNDRISRFLDIASALGI